MPMTRKPITPRTTNRSRLLSNLVVNVNVVETFVHGVCCRVVDVEEPSNTFRREVHNPFRRARPIDRSRRGASPGHEARPRVAVAVRVRSHLQNVNPSVD